MVGSTPSPGTGKQKWDRVGWGLTRMTSFKCGGLPTQHEGDGNVKLKVAFGYTRTTGGQTWRASGQGTKQEDGDFARGKDN